MTIDDDNSIYVGNIPYDYTENDIRRVFDLYGSVVAVKIVNARDVGGKCYCFVTFTNPRSAIQAINGMNGLTIRGNVIKVNQVHSKGSGRLNSQRDNHMSGSDSGCRGDSSRDGCGCVLGACYSCGECGHFARECYNRGINPKPAFAVLNNSVKEMVVTAHRRINPTPEAAFAVLNNSAKEMVVTAHRRMNPIPDAAFAVLNNSLKEMVVNAPAVKDVNSGRMNAKAVPTVRTVTIKKETSDDNVPLQVDSRKMAGPAEVSPRVGSENKAVPEVTLLVDSGKMAGPEVPPRVGSGKKADPELPSQEGSVKKSGPSGGIFSDKDSEDMVLKLEDITIIKGFPVPNIYVDLYNEIYQKHGHIATKEVIKNSMTALYGLVVDLLVVITEMKRTSHLDLTATLLKQWKSKVSTAEAVKFNVGWLRNIVEEIGKYPLIYEFSHLILKELLQEYVEEVKKAQEEFDAATNSKEALKVQLLAAEKHAAELEKKLNGSQILVKSQLEAKDRLIAHQRQSVLTGLL